MDLRDLGQLPDRIMSRIETPSLNECWTWKGGQNGRGYAQTTWQGKKVYVHRLLYRICVGEIPSSWQVDHVRSRGCTLRHCVNPYHLEAVTPAINHARSSSTEVTKARHQARTHCKRGHEFTPANTLHKKYGRSCRECSKYTERLRYQRTKTEYPGDEE